MDDDGRTCPRPRGFSLSKFEKIGLYWFADVPLWLPAARASPVSMAGGSPRGVVLVPFDEAHVRVLYESIPLSSIKLIGGLRLF